MSLEIPEVESDKLKIFISYSSRDYKKASIIHTMFKDVDIDCFLAQNDIKAGNSWNPEIFKKLMESNFFILMLSENFVNSSWCNQEASIAFLQHKLNDAPLIPIRLDDTTPYGIFYDVHGIRYDDFDSIKEFIDLVGVKHASFDAALERHEELESKEIEKIIDDLRQSNNFKTSNELFKRLNNKNVTPKQIDEITEIALLNNQVLESFEGSKFLPKYFHKFEGQLNEKNVEKYKKHWGI